MGDFTTREIAIAFWVVVGCVLYVIAFGRKVNLVDMARSVLRAALHWQIVVPVGLVVAFAALEVIGLRAIGFWTEDLLKDAVVWFVFSGIALGVSGIIAKPGWLRRVVLEQARAVILVEYVVNTYTLSLLAEMVLVPAIVIVGLFNAVAKTEERFKPAERFASVLLQLLGLVVVGLAFGRAFSSLAAVDGTETLRKILLAPVLSLILIPFAYLLALYSAYEVLFSGLRGGKPVGEAWLAEYAKRKLVAHLGIRLDDIIEFTRRRKLALVRAASREEIEDLLALDTAERKAGGGVPRAPAGA